LSDRDWHAAWNFHLSGSLASLDFLNAVEFSRVSIRELPIEDLRRADFSERAFSSRMIAIRQAAAVREGGLIGEGVEPHRTHLFDHIETERVVRLADLELRLEEMRREFAPEAPSRIACLYLAEDSVTGRNMVWRLKGRDAFLMRVRVANAERVFRADPRWLDEPWEQARIERYWAGDSEGDSPLWEYLLDGQIEATDPSELERLVRWAPDAMLRATQGSGPPGDA
jgi:hypothetical protein